MKIFNKSLALMLTLVFALLTVSASFTAAAAELPVFSLNVLSENDSSVTVSVNLESGSFCAVDFGLKINGKTKLSGCVSAGDGADYLDFGTETVKSGKLWCSAVNPEKMLYSSASNVPFGVPGGSVAVFELAKKADSLVTAEDFTLTVTACADGNDGAVSPSAVSNIPSASDTFTEAFYLDKAGEDADNGYAAYSVAYGRALTVPKDPVREGCSFRGWYDYKTGSPVDLTEEKMDSTGGRSFYAVWEPNEYKAYFYADESLFTTVTNVYGEAFIVPRSPSKDGFRFSGWNPELPQLTPAGDLTFNAVFEAEKYVAVVKVDGEVYKEIPYVYGQKSVALPDVPGKPGYTGSWESYSLGIGGVTINAVYTPCTYTAVLKVDGEIYKEIPYVYGQKSLSLPDVPGKPGYTGSWESYSLGIGGVTINAVYTPVPSRLRSVSVSGTDINYKKSAKLNTSVDASGSYTVEYTSSDGSVVSVDNEGNIYGAKRGSAAVTCTVTDGLGNRIQDTCTVNVKYAWWQWIIVIVLFGWIWY